MVRALEFDRVHFSPHTIVDLVSFSIIRRLGQPCSSMDAAAMRRDIDGTCVGEGRSEEEEGRSASPVADNHYDNIDCCVTT